MEKTFKYALFDLDGTLCDTEGQYTGFWGSIGRKYRPDVPNFEHEIKGTTLKQIFERYFPNIETQIAINPALEEFERNMDFPFFDGAREFIADIKKHGVKCAIVTSSNQLKMASVYKKVADFATLFDEVFTAENFTASKPAPDCYLFAASAFGAELSECVVFEDAYNGLEAGMASGIFTIGVATGHTVEEIADKCNHVITGYEGLDYEKVSEIINSK